MYTYRVPGCKRQQRADWPWWDADSAVSGPRMNCTHSAVHATGYSYGVPCFAAVLLLQTARIAQFTSSKCDISCVINNIYLSCTAARHNKVQ